MQGVGVECPSEILSAAVGQGRTASIRSFILLFTMLLILKSAVSLHVWLPLCNLPYFYRTTPGFLFLILILGLAARFYGRGGFLLAAAVGTVHSSSLRWSSAERDRDCQRSDD
jgi:hypothetical protein